jgi:two-component system nitrate/nitrite response regulator NarL
MESEHLCDSIVKVLAGESVVSPEMMTKLVTLFAFGGTESCGASRCGRRLRPRPFPAPARCSRAGLSPREREILLLIAQGDSNKLIARELDIAETTVKIHVQHILRKLG